MIILVRFLLWNFSLFFKRGEIPMRLENLQLALKAKLCIFIGLILLLY